MNVPLHKSGHSATTVLCTSKQLSASLWSQPHPHPQLGSEGFSWASRLQTLNSKMFLSNSPYGGEI